MPSTMGVDPSLSIMGFVAVLVSPNEIEFESTLDSRSELHGYLELSKSGKCYELVFSNPFCLACFDFSFDMRSRKERLTRK